MNILILGRGKTGSLVAEVARQRRHTIQVVGAAENAGAAVLTVEKLPGIDVVIDFTAPSCVISHIEACVRANKNMVVGTTGWHGELDRIRELVKSHATGFIYGANFSIGVNIFFEAARAAAPALRHDYTGQIFERHHAHKKDAPSGTAIALQQVMREAGKALDEFGIAYEIDVTSAHRSPDRTADFARQAAQRGIQVIIAGAGGAAHLAGVIAAHTTLPVIGVPIPSTSLQGMDSLLATVQMPAGIPVATVAIGKPGATNAGILAAQMIALGDTSIAKKLEAHKEKLARGVEEKSKKLKSPLS